MMHQLKIICDKSLSFGSLTLKTDEYEIDVLETKTFYFESETEVELICTPLDNSELVEVVNSHKFLLNNNSVSHFIKVLGEMK